MILSLLFILALAFAGMALTYLVAEDKPLLWRLSAGNIIGAAVWGMAIFVLGFVGGFNMATVAASFVLTLAPAALLLRKDIRRRFDRDVLHAKDKLQGANRTKALRFTYYAAFFVLFFYFFGQAVYVLRDGIYSGGSQNLGDLPFHLGAIFSFTEGANFPPQNPSWAGAKFSYPFIADLLTACFVKLGADFASAIVIQDISWAFSLFVIFESFARRITGSRLAGRLAPILLFLSGGLSFVWVLKDASAAGKGFVDFLWHLPHDYTISEGFRWGNTMTALFMTQRSLLLGMPVTILVLAWLWRAFTAEEAGNAELNKAAVLRIGTIPFLVGLLAGTLPLIHLHSLATLFIVTACLFLFRPDKWMTWIAFGVGTAVVALPELAWSIAGTATETSKFFGWHFGWDKGDADFFWFWLRNTGLLFPLLGVGLWLVLRPGAPPEEKRDHKKGKKDREEHTFDAAHARKLALFYVPFAVIFVISNVAKFAPWEWDNIKVLIYWFVASVPIVALALTWMWNKSTGWKVAAAGCIALLTISGAIDVWRTASGQVKMQIHDKDAVALAEQLKLKTDPHSIFVNAPTYNSAIVLSGRPSLMRYSGHLASYGIDYLPRENDVKRIYEGGGVSDMLLKNYNVDYLLISPEERNSLKANEDFFKKYPVIAESGQYKVYKVKQ